MQNFVLNIAQKLEGGELLDSRLSFRRFIEFLKDRKMHEKTMKLKYLEFVISHFENRLAGKDTIARGAATATVATALAATAAGTAAGVAVVMVDKRRHLTLSILQHGAVVVLERNPRFSGPLGLNVVPMKGAIPSQLMKGHVLDVIRSLLHLLAFSHVDDV